MSAVYEVGLIENEGLEVFSDFLTEEVISDLKQGEEYILLGATRDGLACGAVAGYPEEDNLFRVMSVYVAPEARREGVGTKLFDTLLTELFQIDEEMVLTMEFGEDEEGEAEALIGFMNARGIPESDNDGDESFHRFTFFAEM